MLTKQICLVLGAGASQPYGFPTGGELMQYIRGTQPDEWWPLAKAVTGFGPDEHAAFVSRLSGSGVTSIDQFVGGNPASEKYAKALIAQFVGRAEDTANVLNRPPGTSDWANYLKERIVNNVWKFEALKPRWPHVVTFNYDRSFEEIILQRLVHSFEDATQPLVADLLRKWQIVHVHGSLGDHPALTADGSGRPFERTLDPAALEAAISRILLVHDAKKDSPEFTRARALIQDAESVFFLGFAFHSSNLEKLFPLSAPRPTASLFATQWPDAASALKKASGRGIVLNGPGGLKDCRDLLDEHAHTYSD
jgi:hypothetical protein